MYVCMYVSIYVSMYVCVYVCRCFFAQVGSYGPKYQLEVPSQLIYGMYNPKESPATSNEKNQECKIYLCMYVYVSIHTTYTKNVIDLEHTRVYKCTYI